MRKQLASENGQRKKFTATFVRIGKKTNFKGYSEDTLLLKNVTDSTTRLVVADHIWFTYTKGFEQAGIKEGDQIEFEARVKEYSKGYVNRKLSINSQRTDFKLSHPTKILVIKKPV